MSKIKYVYIICICLGTPRLKDTAVNMRVSILSIDLCNWSLFFSLRENHQEKTPQMSSPGEIFSDGERASRASSRADSWGARRVRMSMSTSGVGSSSSSCPPTSSSSECQFHRPHLHLHHHNHCFRHHYYDHHHHDNHQHHQPDASYVQMWIWIPIITTMVNISTTLKIMINISITL